MKKWPKLICSTLYATVLGSITFASSSVFAMEGPVTVPSKSSFAQLTNHQKFAREQLVATVRLYDEHLRVAETGQYLDRVDLHQVKQDSVVSSIASTGVGLISLAIGDQLGEIDNAAEKASFTLANLLNRNPQAGFVTPRSKSGWYKHFINAYTGAPRNASKDVFSTIDTAILGVGASMVARYFEPKAAHDEVAAQAVKLANELVQSINWGQAVRFGSRPGMHQVFRGYEEEVENRFWSLIFDEYVVLPCIGRAVEAGHGRRGPASVFWDQQLSNIAGLPQADYENLSVLAVNGKNFTSHFTHQFAFYFCGELANDAAYKAELNELRLADQKWFKKAGNGAFPSRWWGLGAGSEIKFDKETGEIKYSGYGVARIGKNPNLTFSPAIMAGFIPAETSSKKPVFRISTEGFVPRGHSEIVADLIALHERNECRYEFADLDFLWRCTANDPSLRVRHVEGVDLSTYMLGLAWFDPAIGEEFFDDYAVRARPGYPEARELRANLSAR